MAGAGASAGAEGRAPGAPHGLAVHGGAAPLAVDSPPEFAWLVSDDERGAVQTAYQILVSAAPTTEPAAASVRWDSGPVSSSEQAFVAYAGPRLAPGRIYWWTVRTAGRAGRFGPFAPPARFETGLRDRDWRAAWLRRGSFSGGPEDWSLFRREIALGASPIARARAFLSASHHYELRLNGRRVDQGPAFAYPDEQYYQVSDVTPWLRPGEPNAIGLVAHWYGAGQGRPAAAPGVIARLLVEHEDGTREVLVSDGSWRVARGPWERAPRRNEEGDFVERMDGRAWPLGWDRPGFDDRSWEPAAVAGWHPAEPWTHLRAQRTRIAEEPWPARSLTRLASGALVADFGRVVAAVPSVRFRRGVAGRRLGIRAGYLLEADGRVSRTRGTQATDLSYRYVQREGAQTFRPQGYLGFRYLEIEDPGERLSRRDVTALARHAAMPDERAASFASSSPGLAEVFELARHSALYGSQEQFVDTPTREKGQFLADAFAISSATQRAFLERGLTRQALLDFAGSQARYWPDGRINAVFPNGDGRRDIPDFTLLYAEWVWRTYLETGDRVLLSRLYPVLVRIADYAAAALDPRTGLITDLPGGEGEYAHGIVDWPPAMRYGYDRRTRARTTLNALAVGAFRRVARVAAELSRPGAEVARQRQRAAALARAMNARLRRADGLYTDGLYADGSASSHASQHASAYALAYGIAPPSRRAALAGRIAGLGMRMGPLTAPVLLRALHAGGRDDALVALLTDAREPGWARILARGGTFTWESWNAREVAEDSESHAWGAAVLPVLQEALLGVRITRPGAARIEVRPPRAALADAAGRFPTQRGPVEVAWRRPEGGGFELDLAIPPNVVALVFVPAPSAEAVREGDAAAVDSPGVTLAGAEPGAAVFEVGAGRYAFRSGAAVPAAPTPSAR